MEKPTLMSLQDPMVLKYIEHLESELKIFTESSYSSSYVSMKKIIDTINNQIQKLTINITSDDGEKQFKTISNYAKQLQEYSKQLDFFKSKMKPEEIKVADEKVKSIVTKEDGVEQFLQENQ